MITIVLGIMGGLGLLVGVSVYSAVKLARETDRLTLIRGDD